MTSPVLARARIATFIVFAVNGLLLAVWVVSIPDIQRATDVSEATIGTLLLLLGGAGFVGMQLAGGAADRYGSRVVTTITGLMSSAAVLLPALATNVTTLALSLAAFGFCVGAMDVSMNAHAVGLERQYGRPILAAFHAFFSIGGAIGAFGGAIIFGSGITYFRLMSVTGLACLVAIAVVFRYLLSAEQERAGLPAQATVAHDSETPARRKTAGLSKPVVMLGMTAFLLMMAEGVANDWSALQIQDHFDATSSTAAIGYGVFAVTMTIGRFSTDRIVRVIGPAPILIWGAATAAIALVIISQAGQLWLNYLGWGILGLGLSGCVAQLFTASGNLPGISPGVAMSRVVGMGYLGVLAGPAVIGWLTHVVTLSDALLLPALGCAVSFVIARYAKKYLPRIGEPTARQQDAQCATQSTATKP